MSSALPKAKGGARPGAGRPKAEPKTIIRLRLTPAQHAAYLERGGDVWLKSLIDEVLQKR